MAGMKSIDEARESLEEAMLMAVSTVKACREVLDQLQIGDEPSWLFVLGRHIGAWEEASNAYMMAVHHHARPILNDMERLSTSK